jgi:SAM-dependent methyltransferase
MPKLNRTSIINTLIEHHGYRKYLEIGVRDSRKNFDKIRIKEKTGVDPSPLFLSDHAKKNVYTITSDIFFEALLENPQYDIVFIDGMHLAEYVYRDVYNAVRVMKRSGVIVLHDINPPSFWHQRSYEEFQNNPGNWNGTCWKAFVRIREHAALPQRIMTVDCDWGVGVIFKEALNFLPAPDTVSFDDLSYHDILEQQRQTQLNLIHENTFFDKFGQ